MCPSAPFDPGSLARAARCNGRYGMSPAITASRLRGRPALTDSAPEGSMSETDEIGCELALKRLLEFIDHELSESEHDSVEQHLRTCRSCFSRMEFESRIKQRLSALSTADVPSTSRDRVRNLIKRF